VSRQFNVTDGEFYNERSGGYALDCDGLRCAGDGSSARGSAVSAR
jgi:hypothetical protein